MGEGDTHPPFIHLNLTYRHIASDTFFLLSLLRDEALIMTKGWAGKGWRSLWVAMGVKVGEPAWLKTLRGIKVLGGQMEPRPQLISCYHVAFRRAPVL